MIAWAQIGIIAMTLVGVGLVGIAVGAIMLGAGCLSEAVRRWCQYRRDTIEVYDKGYSDATEGKPRRKAVRGAFRNWRGE